MRRRAGPAPPLPSDVLLPKGLTLPAGDRARLVAYNDQDFGFLRLTVDARKRVLRGEFFAVANPATEPGGKARRTDSFTLDLSAHVLG